MDYLKALAEPFVDTPATVLDRLIEQHRVIRSQDPRVSSDSSNPAAKVEYRIENLPPLLHTKVEAAQIDGVSVSRPKWSVLVEEMIKRIGKKGSSATEIAASINAHTTPKERSDTGFVFVKEAGISFQKMDANRSCKAILALSRHFGIAVSIDFFWRDDPKAFRAGSSGKIVGP